MPSTLWILTEERPKVEVLKTIIGKFIDEHGLIGEFSELKVVPTLDDDGRFLFSYLVTGLNCDEITEIRIETITGSSSFVDFLIFYQDSRPIPSDRPLYAIEETKTDDAESRNTGVFQRATKFVYLELCYPNIDKTMLYNLQVVQKSKPTDTNIFGSRCLSTIGVRFLGKEIDNSLLRKFDSVEEMIQARSHMKRPPAGNVPIDIAIDGDSITVSGRLFKSGGLSHDPNIGALSLIAATVRKVGWHGDIRITKHGLNQNHVKAGNKFVQVANQLGISLDGLKLPTSTLPSEYWHYERSGEKIGTIFLHLIIEHFSQGQAIYENHAGCERGYFYPPKGEPIAIEKKVNDPGSTFHGDKIAIPDLVVRDISHGILVNIEGKKSENVNKGIAELNNFGAVEKYYLSKYYPESSIERTVVLYGGNRNSISQVEVSFLLNSLGEICVSSDAPQIIHEAVQNLRNYWSAS